MSRNTFSKDVDKVYNDLLKIRKKHNISYPTPDELPTHFDRAEHELRQAFIEAIIDEEMERTKGKTKRK